VAERGQDDQNEATTASVCAICGASHQPGDRFCAHCGAPLTTAAREQVTAAAAATPSPPGAAAREQEQAAWIFAAPPRAVISGGLLLLLLAVVLLLAGQLDVTGTIVMLSFCAAPLGLLVIAIGIARFVLGRRG
jgi:ribosomal protein L32